MGSERRRGEQPPEHDDWALGIMRKSMAAQPGRQRIFRSGLDGEMKSPYALTNSNKHRTNISYNCSC